MKTPFLIAGATALCGMSAPTPAAQPGPAPFVAPPPIRRIVDRQLGAKYSTSEREAIARCATAALAQGAIMYGVNGYAGAEGYAAYVGAYRPGGVGVPGFPGIAATTRVSAITDVQRRSDGMRVKGLIDSGVIYRGGYGGEAYQGGGEGGEAYAFAILAIMTWCSDAISTRPGLSAACASNAIPRRTGATEPASCLASIGS